MEPEKTRNGRSHQDRGHQDRGHRNRSNQNRGNCDRRHQDRACALDAHTLRALLERHGTLASPALLPELELFHCCCLDEVWEEAERVSNVRIAPPFWAFVWPGGQAVARYVLDHEREFRGQRVLDIGCGDGVIALAAAKAGGQAIANDIDPLALLTTEEHARINGIEVETWEGDLMDTDPATLPFDVVAVGDAFYEAPFASRLQAWLEKASRANRQVLIGDPGRNFLPEQGLQSLATYRVETLVDVEGVSVREPRVFRFVGSPEPPGRSKLAQ